MSKMIQCDECKKMMYTDSREDKGAYISMTADDPLFGYSSFHLCRKCFDKKFPFLIDVEERVLDLCDSCFYRDYIPDYEPCSNCLKDMAKTGEFTHYVNAISEQEEGRNE